MTAQRVSEERRIVLGGKQIVEELGWAGGVAWTTSPRLVVAAAALSLARSTVAAELAVTARGLINAAVAESQSGQADVQEPGRRDLLRQVRESSATGSGDW